MEIKYLLIRLLYILIISIIQYSIYQYLVIKKDDLNKQKINDKLKIYGVSLILSIGLVAYFNIGVDEIKYGGEVKLNDTIKFEKRMINNIYQDVDVGTTAPF